MIKKYCKKSVVVEAVKFGGSSTYVYAIMAWMKGGRYIEPKFILDNIGSMYIPTLEGSMKVNPGDYVIKGIKGEFYPCKPDVFEATYDPVDNQ